jgi:predicted component of type VI protein secretion system
MPRVTISEPGKTPQPYRFKLERKIINIGRGSDNDIILECGSCSTHHCVMQRIEGGYILKDAGSTNGIKQDDTLMEIIDLIDGMDVLVGDVPLEFSLSAEELAILSDEEFTPHSCKKLPQLKDAIIEEEEHPTTSSPRASHSHRSPNTLPKSNEGLKTFIILILMILAVGIGLTLRHFKETGDFLPAKWMQSF